MKETNGIFKFNYKNYMDSDDVSNDAIRQLVKFGFFIVENVS